MPRNMYRGANGLVLFLLACCTEAALQADNTTSTQVETPPTQAAAPTISPQLTDWLDGEIAALSRTVQTLPRLQAPSATPAGHSLYDAAPERPAARCPYGAIAVVRERLAEAGEAMRRIDRWSAERPEPPGGVEALVAAARDYAVEQTNLRAMQRTLRNLVDAMTRWAVLHTGQAAEDRDRLEKIRRQIEDRQDCAACVTDLADWGDALAERLQRCGNGTENAVSRKWSQPAEQGSAGTGDKTTPADVFVTVYGQARHLLRSFRDAMPAERDASRRTEGAAVRLTRTAGAYPAAAETRRRLQSQLDDLVCLVDKWGLTVVGRLADRRRRLCTLLDNLTTENAANNAHAEEDCTPENLESFEYYEVHTPSTLREISALPSLYGDPDQWQKLKEANPDAPTEPDQDVPKGTVLVIPRGQVNE